MARSDKFGLVVIAAVLLDCFSIVLTTDDEICLIRKLLTENPYSHLMLPSENSTGAVVVSFGVDLVQIIDVDERNQEMKTNVWLKMSWWDYQLLWDPYDYGNVAVIRLLPHRVWRPDIVLLNNADSKYEVSYSSNVLVQSDGSVSWVPPAIYRSSCTINVEYFPFDEQVCEMKFGSWTYDTTELKFGWANSCVMLVTNYLESGVWYVMDARGQIAQDTRNPPREYVAYRIILRRRVLFYTINLVIPIALISLFTTTIFYIPACEGEKVTLGICITVSLAVFFTLLSKLLPSTSLSVSLMSKYLLFTFITNVSAIFVTVVIINWNYRTPRTHRMPCWARAIFLNYLPKVLRMTPPDHVVEEQLHKRLGKHAAPSYLGSNAALINSSLLSSPPPSSQRERKLYSAQCSTDEDIASFTQNNSAADEESDAEMEFPAVKLRRLSDDETQRQRQRKRAVFKNLLVSAHSAGSGSAAETVAARFRSLPLDDRHEANQVAAIRNIAVLQVKNHFLKNRVRNIIESINFMTLHLDNDDEYNKVLDEWKFAAAVIDRLQLFIFLFVTLAGTLWFLLKTPYLFENVSQSEIIQKLRNESMTQCVA